MAVAQPVPGKPSPTKEAKEKEARRQSIEEFIEMGLSNPGGSSPIKRTIYVEGTDTASEAPSTVGVTEEVPLPPMQIMIENDVDSKKVVKIDNVKSFSGSIKAIKKSKGKYLGENLFRTGGSKNTNTYLNTE